MGLFSTLGGIAGGIGGAFVGGPGGALAGYGAGSSLGGLTDGQDPYKAPSFSDIDLKSANPELWAQLQKELALADESEKLYHQRQEGMNYSERAGLNESLAGVTGRQAQMGQLGSAVGNAQMADAEARLRSNLAQRAFQEQQQLLEASQQARAQYAQHLLGGQQAVLSPMTQQSQMNYQNQMAEEQAKNQFNSGLLGAGLSFYGNQQNMSAMKDMNDQRIAAMYQTGVPYDGYSGPMQRGNSGGYQPSFGYETPTFGSSQNYGNYPMYPRVGGY